MARSILAAFAAVAVSVAPAAANPAFPETIPLPDGFQPEGIAIGRGTTFYVGSIPTGAVYSGDIRTGEGDVLVPPQDGRAAIGVEFDRRGRLWVAGGPNGNAFVYDAGTGETLAVYELTTGDAFINDVVVTKEAAFFTDSPNPVLYRLPLGPGGSLPTEVQTVPLTGDYMHQPGTFNLNGIHATPDGGTLVVVQSGPGPSTRSIPVRVRRRGSTSYPRPSPRATASSSTARPSMWSGTARTASRWSSCRRISPAAR